MESCTWRGWKGRESTADEEGDRRKRRIHSVRPDAHCHRMAKREGCIPEFPAKSPCRTRDDQTQSQVALTGDEHDVVTFLQLVLELPLELPVGIVDEDEDARASGVLREVPGLPMEMERKCKGKAEDVPDQAHRVTRRDSHGTGRKGTARRQVAGGSEEEEEKGNEKEENGR